MNGKIKHDERDRELVGRIGEAKRIRGVLGEAVEGAQSGESILDIINGSIGADE